jgi:hypothetical protein
MQKKNIKIVLIAVAVIITSFCIAYFLDFSKWNEVRGLDAQIKQTKASIEAKKSYYTIIDSKMGALTSAGWSTKKQSIAVNFTSTPFFIPKTNSFLQTMVLGNGMSLVGITSSSAVGVKASDQPVAKTESTSKSTKKTEVVATTPQPVEQAYFNKLQGPIKRTTVNLNVAGSYTAFKNLLSQLENQTRIITIKNVVVAPATQEMSKDGKPIATNNLTFNVVLDVYSY